MTWRVPVPIRGFECEKQSYQSFNKIKQMKCLLCNKPEPNNSTTEKFGQRCWSMHDLILLKFTPSAT